MAASPRYKAFVDDEYVASFKHLIDAAAFIGTQAGGATIRDGHQKTRILWTEGHEDFPAGESWDRCVDVMTARCVELRERRTSHRR